jgi:hypothetical protein
MYVYCCVQFDMLNHMYVISMFSFRHIYEMPWAVSGSCQPFVTFTEDSAAPGSEISINCSTQKKSFVLWRKAWWVFCVWVYVCVCTQEQDFFSNTRKKKLGTLWWVAKWLTALFCGVESFLRIWYIYKIIFIPVTLCYVVWNICFCGSSVGIVTVCRPDHILFFP